MLFFDTETTGLGPDADVIEFALIDLAGNVLFAGRCSPVNAAEWPDAQQVNGIAPEEVAGLPTWPEVYPLFLQHCRGEDIVIYNAKYDLQYCPGLVDVAQVHCCMNRFAAWFGEWDYKHDCPKWQRLAKAAEVADYTWPIQAHSAIGDTLATRHVWMFLDQQRAEP